MIEKFGEYLFKLINFIIDLIYPGIPELSDIYIDNILSIIIF